ncbi:MAG: hypothetical protein H6633_00095 [Anaerolineales bacterium]|nr:hypothetical protein [Anaerolineales bacterium]
MTAGLKHYLPLETALKAGNATEPPHRPALKTLLEPFEGNKPFQPI